MAEITADGYQSLKDFVVSTTAVPNDWDHIALYDDAASEVTRLEISTDSRADWVDLDGDPIVAVEVRVSGSDSDIPQPTTFEYAAIFDDTAANSGRQVTQMEQYATRTIDQDGDAITVTHTVEIPNQP